MGFKLETMSLLGLSLAIGILIDDAIVVRENIVRHVEMGKDHYTAAREGTDEIGLAVAATTFSILAVFVPIGFMPGDRRAVVQAVRADDRVLGARVAVRLLLARPDALRVLGGSASRRSTRSGGSRSSSTGSTTGSIARRRTTRRSSRGRSITARRWSTIAIGRVLRRRSRCRRRASPGSRPRSSAS